MSESIDFLAVVHRVDGDSSYADWKPFADGGWGRMHAVITNVMNHGEIEQSVAVSGTFDSGDSLSVTATSSAWRWAVTSNPRFCTLQQRGKVGGAFGFFCTDAHAAEALTKFMSSALPLRRHHKRAADADEHAGTAASGSAADAAGAEQPAYAAPSEAGSSERHSTGITDWLSRLPLPEAPAWRSDPFGVPPADVAVIDAPGYGPVPAILAWLWHGVASTGGFTEEGTFRVGPDAAAPTALRRAIKSGPIALPGSGSTSAPRSPHVYTSLFKVWFREARPAVLDGVPEAAIAAGSRGDAAAIARAVEELQPACYRAALLLLLDAGVAVSAAPATRMNLHACAVVFAPNMLSFSGDNPMKQMEMAQKVTGWLHKAMEWRASGKD